MSTQFKSAFSFALFSIFVYAVAAFAGITGTLSGKVSDKETGQVLPGAAIVVEGTTIGAMADKNGEFTIQNLPAGVYDVTVRMIGYSTVTVKQVQINVDLNTVLSFQISAEVLPLEEVVILKQRDLIQSEITSSTYFLSEKDINDKLPLDSFRDAISTLPGVVGNHFRGGRETDVIYMLDGLPIQGALSRQLSSYFPNSSIIEMMVQTGGYTAEYGNASSGIVNVISKEGRNRVAGNLKLHTDFFDTGLTGNDNTRRMEFNVGGPLTVGLGGPLLSANYFVSADLNVSDTRFREKMDDAFDSPIFSNYNINSKLSFDLGESTSLALQGLLSNFNWHRFDPQWELNLSGLAENSHRSHRLSASLTHTFNPRFFAAFRFANYRYDREILGAEQEHLSEIRFANPNDPTSPIISGRQPWSEDTEENVNFFKLDLVRKLREHHLLKAGVELQRYDIESESVRFDFVPLRDETVDGIVFNRLQNNFRYEPDFFSVYLQDKIEVGGITANLGTRYEVFDARIELDDLPQDFQILRSKTRGPNSETKSRTHSQISPRLGLSLPLSENERVHFNYGWYFQMPPLYYVYTNAGHDVNAYFPIIGDMNLEPLKTVSTELSYKRSFANNGLFVITGFMKSFKNLVDSQAFVITDSVFADNQPPAVGFTKISDVGEGRASGVELTVQNRFSDRLSARLSYTWMKARGTSSAAEERAMQLLSNKADPEDLADLSEEFPLSWDQRHSFVLESEYRHAAFQLNLLYRLMSPLPVTTEGSLKPNNARLSWSNIFDLRVKLLSGKMLGGRLHPFFEVRNLFDDQAVINPESGDGVRAYRLFDPLATDSIGRRLRVGVLVDF